MDIIIICLLIAISHFIIIYAINNAYKEIKNTQSELNEQLKHIRKIVGQMEATLYQIDSTVMDIEDDMDKGPVRVRKEIIEETIAWMKTIVFQETANGYAERLISDNMIEEYKKVIGYEN